WSGRGGKELGVPAWGGLCHAFVFTTGGEASGGRRAWGGAGVGVSGVDRRVDASGSIRHTRAQCDSTADGHATVAMHDTTALRGAQPASFLEDGETPRPRSQALLLHFAKYLSGRVFFGIADDLDPPSQLSNHIALGNAVEGVVRALGLNVGMNLADQWTHVGF